MSDKLRKNLTKFNKSLSKEPTIIAGELGIKLGGKKQIAVTGRKGFVYVRLRTNLSEPIQAFNDKVSEMSYGLPVLVKRDGNRYVIVGRDVERYSVWETSNKYVSEHAQSHAFDKNNGKYGNDPVWISSYQFMPGLVAPFSSLGAPNAFINPYSMRKDDGGWIYAGNTGTINLVQYRPSTPTGSALIVVGLDRTTGNPYYIGTGTPNMIPVSTTGTAQILKNLPLDLDENHIPLSVIKLSSGTTKVSWGEIYDLRQFYGTNAVSTSSGTGDSFVWGGWDDGKFVSDDGTILEAGNNLRLTASGTVYRLDVLGGGTDNFYFFHSGTITGSYRLMDMTHATGTSYIVSTATTSTGTTVGEWLTNFGDPGVDFISDGIYHTHIHARKTSGGTKDVRLLWRLFKYNAGVETLLITSEHSDLLGTDFAEFDIEIFSSEYEISTSDRLLIKLYAELSGVGSSPTIELEIDGTTSSRLELPSFGGDGGTASINIQDEGVAQGSATTLDFVGSGVTASVVGNVATITITASTGTSSTLDLARIYAVIG
jgi:hypothetical protein